MNTKVLRPALSLSAIAFAVFGAFAFSSVPEKGKLIDVYGHNPLEDCDVTTVQCSTAQSSNVCRVSSGGQQLFDMSSPTQCNVELFRKIN
jgi:hypothetical protein